MLKNVKRELVLAHLALGGLLMVWGSSLSAQKVVSAATPIYLVVLVRMALGLLALAPFYGRILKVRIRPGDFKWLLLMALCEPCLYFVLEFNALRFTSASQAGLVMAFYPVFVAIGAAIFLKDHLPPRAKIGFGAAFVGVCFLTVSGADGEPNAVNPLLGNSLEVMAMVLGAIFSLITRQMAPHYPPIFLTSFTIVVGFIFFLPLGLYDVFTSGTGALFHGPAVMLNLLYLGVVVTLGGLVSLNYAMKHIKASTLAMSMNLLPLAGMCFGVWLMGDILTGAQYFWASLVLLAVLISQGGRKA